MVRWTGILAVALILCGCATSANRALHGELISARDKGAPFLIYAFGVPGEIQSTNTTTAVPVYVQFVVTSAKPLERVEFLLLAYSQRGTKVRRNGRPMALTLIGPGPFNPDGNYEVNSFHARPAGFPGGDVACVELAGARVTYGDGENVWLGAGELRMSLLPVLRNRDCVDQGPNVSDMFSDH